MVLTIEELSVLEDEIMSVLKCVYVPEDIK
mgnify:CR=1 FL=1